VFHSPALFDAQGRQATGRQTEGQTWREMPPSMAQVRRSAIHAASPSGFEICSFSLRSSTVTTGLFIISRRKRSLFQFVRSHRPPLLLT
jgi:hypothetical protein